MNLTRYFFAINILLIALATGMLFFGNLSTFIIADIAVFIFVITRVLLSQTRKRHKLWLIISYLFVLTAQVVISTQVFIDDNGGLPEHLLRKLFCVLLLLLPLAVNRLVSVGKYTHYYLPSLQEVATVSFAELNSGSKKVARTLGGLNNMGKSLSPGNVKTIIGDLPRHDSFRYINNGSLTDEYFVEAEKTLKDPFVYVVISSTGSAASEMISVFTQKQYNHASLSFDSDLKTIISYNGGERVYPPGLNPEMMEFFNKKEDASIIVYRLACTSEQKEAILNKIKEINREGSAYNMLGLVLKYSHKPNIMFCSQFVYKMLEFAGLAYFEKKDGKVKPTDLVELDYYRMLEFDHEIRMN